MIMKIENRLFNYYLILLCRKEKNNSKKFLSIENY